MKETYFERAIFLAWFCAKPDCKFCYMSTLKGKIPDPRKARRRIESVLAEAIITKLCNWKIEFISTGITSHSTAELVDILQKITEIAGEKQWLNIGVLRKEQLEKFSPYIKGVTGTVETINPEVRAFVCPSKPLEPIIEMFKHCDELGLKKSITIIIGLGEKEEDIPLLIDFVKKYDVDRVIFYALNPHEETIFKKGPESEYYAKWISAVRKEFPNLEIIAGSWVNRLKEIPLLLNSGATAITKFPAIKLFGSEYAHQIVDGANSAGYEFTSNLLDVPKIDIEKELSKYNLDDELKQGIKKKLEMYLKAMAKNHS